jgi:FHS family glucose/mannose:H+ symporter-like MFS transporter
VAATSGTASSSGPDQLRLKTALARKALAGFFLSGLLSSYLGAILPAWGYHLTEDYQTVGNYFLSMNLGIWAALWISARVLPKTRLGTTLVVACTLACSGFLYLALVTQTFSPWWRMAGVLAIGCGAGLLNSAMFQAITPLYRLEPAATVNLAGTFFGLGCVVMAILAAGTFYVYSVPSILVFIALIPGFFIFFYARRSIPAELSEGQPSWKQAFSDFRSPIAVLFALLLFFQFGNEWAIAGWLPLFLCKSLGVSPESSLVMLAVYWLALLVGRTLVVSLLPRLHHGKLLMGSAIGALLGCTILIWTDNTFGAVMGILLVGGGFAPVYPLVVEKIGGRFPYYRPGFFNGIFSIGLTGGLLAPWSLGFFTDAWGIGAVMKLPLLGTLMVVLLLVAIWAEARFISAPRVLK